jgi:hypothetical protein
LEFPIIIFDENGNSHALKLSEMGIPHPYDTVRWKFPIIKFDDDGNPLAPQLNEMGIP